MTRPSAGSGRSPSPGSRRPSPAGRAGAGRAGAGRALLERTLARLGRRRAVEGGDPSLASAVAFRTLVDERLQSLQRQLDEVKGRVNGLLFLLAGAVAAQVVLRLLA